jgi:hypothetical protein
MENSERDHLLSCFAQLEQQLVASRPLSLILDSESLSLRAEVVDYIIRVHYIEEFGDSVLWLAVRYIDKYLEAYPQRDTESKDGTNYFLLAITSLILAMKLEEPTSLVESYPLEYFQGIGCKNFKVHDIVSMEQKIVLLFSGMLYIPTVPFFLSQFQKELACQGLIDKGILHLCNYYSENTLLDADFSALPVSQIAAGVLFVAFLCRQQTISQSPSSPQSVTSSLTPPCSPAPSSLPLSTLQELQLYRLYAIDSIGWTWRSSPLPNWLPALEQTTNLSRSVLTELGRRVICTLPDPEDSLRLVNERIHSILAPFLKYKREGTPCVACLLIPTLPNP